MNTSNSKNNSQITVEYVLSALGFGMMPKSNNMHGCKEQIEDALAAIFNILDHKLERDCTHTNSVVSALYNAYTEEMQRRSPNFLVPIWNSVYADSGGLQMVTAGHTITDELKQEVYKVQTFANYAMCFDSIALERETNVVLTEQEQRTRNERSNIKNKIWKSDEHIEAGRQTGQNIKEQIEAFKRLNADTKVIIIVQGNDVSSMLQFYEQIEGQLDDDDYNHIGGIAVADTCIGSGPLESVKMLQAAKHISNNADSRICSHLHILGVGSLERMRPIMYLARSGYLDKFKRISYDSSSHTSTFDYGLLKINGTCTALASSKNVHADEGRGRLTPKALWHFSNVYDFFEEYLATLMTKQEFLELIFTDKADKDSKWTYSSIKNRAKESNSPYLHIAILIKAFHTFYQVHNFMKNVDKMWVKNVNNPTRQENAIFKLRKVTNEDEMEAWLSEIGRKYVKSKQIRNKTKVTSLPI